MSGRTPGPWRVKLSEIRHRQGSPICLETCDKGGTPVRVEHDTPEEAKRQGWEGVTELHVFLTDSVEDIISEDGTHVVCFGHDYDDYGSVSHANARLIAAAPDLLAIAKRALNESARVRPDFAADIRTAIAAAEGETT